jgi:hypothetical protein
MAMAFDNEARHRLDDASDVRGALEEAQALATQAEQLLAKLSQERADSNSFRIRLARAHALSLLDQLSELLEVRSSGYGPAVRDCPAPADDDDAVSGVRQGPWRRSATSSRTD